jgi:hypothetical protein
MDARSHGYRGERLTSSGRALARRLPHAVAGLLLAGCLAAAPYLIVLYEPRNAGGTQVLNILLTSCLGVLLIGLPLGIMAVFILARNDLLSARAIVASGVILPLFLGLPLFIGAGAFGLLFVPGMMIAGMVMATTYWFWVQRHLSASEP